MASNSRLSGMRIAWIGVGVLLLVLAGCSGDNKSTGETSKRGSIVLMMHDAPSDDFKEAWITVESVTMLGAGSDSNGAGEAVLNESVRLDLLSLDSLAQVLAAADVEAGSYSKIRLQVSDPEFLRDDDSVFTGDDIHLVADGHIDLNTQGDVYVLGDKVTVVSLDLDLKNSVQINQTGNGHYILNPQIRVDNDLSDEEGVIVKDALVTSVDLATHQLTLSTTETETNVDLIVKTSNETDFKTPGGLSLSFGSLLVGTTVDVIGTINMETGVITATSVQVVLF